MRLVVFGGSSDIGRATIKRFLSHDYEVVAHYFKDSNALRAIEAEYPGRITKLRCDLGSIEETSRLMEDNASIFSNADAVINLAAHLSPGSLFSATNEDIIKHYSVNTFANVIILKTFTENMRKRCYGRVVLCSSIGVKFGGGRQTALYSMSKWGGEFIPSEVRDLAQYNVLTNVVRIGVTNTKIHNKVTSKDLRRRAELIPAKRMATVEEIASLLYFLGSDINTYISSECISIAGGE